MYDRLPRSDFTTIIDDPFSFRAGYLGQRLDERHKESAANCSTSRRSESTPLPNQRFPLTPLLGTEFPPSYKHKLVKLTSLLNSTAFETVCYQKSLSKYGLGMTSTPCTASTTYARISCAIPMFRCEARMTMCHSAQ
jgi:hypothetical protein